MDLEYRRKIFASLIDAISLTFDIEKDFVTGPPRDSRTAFARHMLYFLAYERRMGPSEIAVYMTELGRKTTHSSVIHSIRSMRYKITNDRDLRLIVAKINSIV